MSRERSAVAVVALLVVTAAWGSTFVVVQNAVAHLPVASFLAWRFVIAGAILVAARPRSLVTLGRDGWVKGVLIGLALGAGYLLQTAGLRYTTAAVSGFLTGLAVVFTPMLAWALFGQRPARRVVAGAVVASLGLAVMSSSGLSMGRGEILTLASAVMFAGQVVGLGRWSSKENAYAIATVQLLTVGAISSVLGFWQGLVVPSRASQWWAILLTAVVATAFAFVVQSWAQARLSPSRTAVVLTMEPVFAALVAWFAGQSIGITVVVGGALVVGAMLVVEAMPTRRVSSRVDGEGGRLSCDAPRVGVAALSGQGSTSSDPALVGAAERA
ncbi:MAG: DMT family transporter [Acidimicrobiales bacterium]